MHNFFAKKRITAFLFILVLVTFSVLNIIQSFGPIQKTLASADFHYSEAKELIHELDDDINEHVFDKFGFVEAYGYMQTLMWKNEENNFEVVKDMEGKLHYTYFATGPTDTKDLSDRIAALGAHLDPKTKLTYVMTPDKYVRGYTKFPEGIPYNYNNETADGFLANLKQDGIDTVDLREGLLESGIPAKDLFFITDHHWKIKTAFWAFGQLVNHLDGMYDKPLDPGHYFTDLNNYNVVPYQDIFIGSQGRKAGKYFAGDDDFDLIYPKFKTDYSFYFKTGETEATLNGRFEDALLTTYPLNVQGATYDLTADKYFTYLYGNQGIVHVVNKDKPNGLKVLFIKDSLAVPMISFLSTVVSEIYLIDPRYYTGDIVDFASETDLDHVFVSISPQDLVDEFFPYGSKD
ncbi:alginate O-acetyltransferase AlgX-related protein [Paenibacillus taichungensis]|uniref:alginate O-acetyltransferase AlgX-related protein n=1 Tax=Paenibacillus taichungensis TaxID=484184 RepID=UPI0035D9EA07